MISSMPDIVKPKRRENEITIPGRNGALHIDEGCYEGYNLSVECGKRGTENLKDIVGWLDGNGDLILSTEPDKVYRARISNVISSSDVIYLYNSFLVQFNVFPFKYSTSAVNSYADNFTLTSPCVVFNKGSVYAEPIIRIYGTGNIILTINSMDYGILGVEEYIIIDSEMMEVYKGNINYNNKFSAMEFPRFEVGENSISWTGNVTKIEIEPKWRWL